MRYSGRGKGPGERELVHMTTLICFFDMMMHNALRHIMEFGMVELQRFVWNFDFLISIVVC
jgi:hypothetical protein